MKLFKKKVEPTNSPARVQRMSDSELLTWFDSSVMLLGRTFDDFRYRGTDATFVTEAVDGINVLWVEYLSRTQQRKTNEQANSQPVK